MDKKTVKTFNGKTATIRMPMSAETTGIIETRGTEFRLTITNTVIQGGQNFDGQNGLKTRWMSLADRFEFNQIEIH